MGIFVVRNASIFSVLFNSSLSGSLLYDYSLYLLAATVVMLLCLLCFLSAKRRKQHVEYIKEFKTLGNVNDTQQQPYLKTIYSSCSKFLGFMKLMAILGSVVLLACVPMYALRIADSNQAHSSHWNTYSWTLSFSQLEGEVMGAMVICVWAMASLVLFVYIFVLSWKEMTTDVEGANNSIVVVPDSAHNVKWNIRVTLAFIGNMSVTLLVNVLYILSITELSLSSAVSFLIRFGVSLFRIISSAIIVPILANQLENHERRSLFMFRLLMFNNLFIPCAVTALTSSNCFQVFSFI